VNFTAKVDDKALIAALIGLGKEVGPALTRSLNRAATSVKTEASRTIREELNLKAGAVSKSIHVGRASAGSPEASIRIAGKQVPLIGFIGTRQVRKGVSVKVKRSGSRKVIAHAFIATMKSGHRGVFTRDKGAGRLPISEMFSIAVQQALKGANIEKLLTLARNRIRTELKSQIAYRTARRSAKL